MKLRTMGIDLGKTVFHLVGLSASGEVVVRKSSLVPSFFASPRTMQVDPDWEWRHVESSHFLGRGLREQGHEVRLIPAQYVKPFAGRPTRTTSSTPKPSPKR